MSYWNEGILERRAYLSNAYQEIVLFQLLYRVLKEAMDLQLRILCNMPAIDSSVLNEAIDDAAAFTDEAEFLRPMKIVENNLTEMAEKMVPLGKMMVEAIDLVIAKIPRDANKEFIEAYYPEMEELALCREVLAFASKIPSEEQIWGGYGYVAFCHYQDSAEGDDYNLSPFQVSAYGPERVRINFKSKEVCPLETFASERLPLGFDVEKSERLLVYENTWIIYMYMVASEIKARFEATGRKPTMGIVIWSRFPEATV